MDGNNPTNTQWWSDATLRSGNQLLFWLNLVCAAAYVLIGRLVYTVQTAIEPGYLYYLQLASVRVYDVFHPIWWRGPASRGDVETGLFMWNWTNGLAIVTVVSAVSLTVIAMLMMRFASVGHAVWFRRLSLGSALLAAPIAIVYRRIYYTTWEEPFREPDRDVTGIILPIFAANVLCVLLAAVWARRRQVSTTVLAGVMAVHYGFWITALKAGILGTRPGWFVILQCVVPVAAGIMALLDLRSRDQLQPASTNRWMVGSAVLALLALAFLWRPARGESLSSGSLSDTRIEVVHGCVAVARCPDYKFVIHGNGSLEFDGRHYVQAQGHHTKSLSAQQVKEILRELDAADFTSLEQRAFVWSFHSGGFRVEVSGGGRSHAIYSDERWKKSGPQGRFLQAVHQIPRIAGIEAWVKCDSECQRRPYPMKR